MRAETWVALVACLIGAAVPLAWVGLYLPAKFTVRPDGTVEEYFFADPASAAVAESG